LSGTTQWNVIVVPDFVPRTVTLPRSELLITTSASVAPCRFWSVTFVILPVIESPTWADQCVRLNASPVCGSPPVGRSRLPGPMLPVSDVAAGARSRAESTIVAATSHEIRLGPALFARASLLFHAMPQFHLMPQYPQTFGYLVKTPVNLR
jgi:hypothetical protein